MDLFEKHEVFEIETLEKLKNNKFLDSLVFGGGTMLRLCHELPRYSADLDFWFLREVDFEKYYNSLNQFLGDFYDLTDSKIKQNRLLFEFRATRYPRRLKIEIRKIIRKWDIQEKIAFSRSSTKQVILKTHTLEQNMKNKIDALLERKEIRDGFYVEFLLRRGITLPELSDEKRFRLKKVIKSFSDKEFKVTLGSVLASDIRDYYVQNRFSHLSGVLVRVR